MPNTDHFNNTLIAEVLELTVYDIDIVECLTILLPNV